MFLFNHEHLVSSPGPTPSPSLADPAAVLMDCHYVSPGWSQQHPWDNYELDDDQSDAAMSGSQDQLSLSRHQQQNSYSSFQSQRSPKPVNTTLAGRNNGSTSGANWGLTDNTAPNPNSQWSHPSHHLSQLYMPDAPGSAQQHYFYPSSASLDKSPASATGVAHDFPQFGDHENRYTASPGDESYLNRQLASMDNGEIPDIYQVERPNLDMESVAAASSKDRSGQSRHFSMTLDQQSQDGLDWDVPPGSPFSGLLRETRGLPLHLLPQPLSMDYQSHQQESHWAMHSYSQEEHAAENNFGSPMSGHGFHMRDNVNSTTPTSPIPPYYSQMGPAGQSSLSRYSTLLPSSPVSSPVEMPNIRGHWVSPDSTAGNPKSPRVNPARHPQLPAVKKEEHQPKLSSTQVSPRTERENATSQPPVPTHPKALRPPFFSSPTEPPPSFKPGLHSSALSHVPHRPMSSAKGKSLENADGVLQEVKRTNRLPRHPHIACMFCRKRKIACIPGPSNDKDIGPCMPCAKRDLDCVRPIMNKRGYRRKTLENDSASLESPKSSRPRSLTASASLPPTAGKREGSSVSSPASSSDDANHIGEDANTLDP